MKITIFSRAAGSVRRFVVRHKILTFLDLLIVGAGTYWGVQSWSSTAGETRYVLTSVSKETIVTSVTGSGQVSASSQIDIKPKVSGDVLSINVAEGQHMQAGTLILQLDSRDAQKAVRDATANLQSAQIALAKLQQPADDLSLT